jgi:quercetin dioxygenase-like cupin family protein
MPDVLLRSEESDGVVSVVDNTVPAHWPGPFLHKHDFDEAFYVLEGELTFQVEDAVVTKRAGGRVICSCARRPGSSATSRA